MMGKLVLISMKLRRFHLTLVLAIIFVVSSPIVIWGVELKDVQGIVIQSPHFTTLHKSLRADYG